MRLARARLADGKVGLARLDGDADAAVLAIEQHHPRADVLAEALYAGTDLDADGACSVPVSELTLLSPVRHPSKIVCVGLNYRDHAAESGADLPERPLLFAKFSNAIVGPEEPIRFRSEDQVEVDYEGELAVIVGTRASHVDQDKALEHVLGYTVANDVSGRRAQFTDGQWLRGKSHDSFCPLGPILVTTDEVADVQDLQLTTRINGTVVQQASTADMVFSVAQVLSYASRFFTFEPGDILLTGTPPGVGFARQPPIFLSDTDTVEVTVEGVGTLRNSVAVLDPLNVGP